MNNFVSNRLWLIPLLKWSQLCCDCQRVNGPHSGHSRQKNDWRQRLSCWSDGFLGHPGSLGERSRIPVVIQMKFAGEERRANLMHLHSRKACSGCWGIKLSPRLFCWSFSVIFSKAVNNHCAVSTQAVFCFWDCPCLLLPQDLRSGRFFAWHSLQTVWVFFILPFWCRAPMPLPTELSLFATVRWAEPLLLSLHPLRWHLNDLYCIYHSQRTTGLLISLFHSLNFCNKMFKVLTAATGVPVAPGTIKEQSS